MPVFNKKYHFTATRLNFVALEESFQSQKQRIWNSVSIGVSQLVGAQIFFKVINSGFFGLFLLHEDSSADVPMFRKGLSNLYVLGGEYVQKVHLKFIRDIIVIFFYMHLSRELEDIPFKQIYSVILESVCLTPVLIIGRISQPFFNGHQKNQGTITSTSN